MKIKVVAFVALLAVGAALAFPITETDETPEQVHVAFTGVASEYVVQWVSFGTFRPSARSVVEYGFSPDRLSLLAYNTPWEFVELRCSSSRIMHSVVISQLIPGSPAYFRVSSDGGAWSPVFEIQVVSTDKNRKQTFSIFGDLGSRYSENSVGKLTIDTKDRVHDFVIHHGDIAYNIDDECNRVGDEFMNAIQGIATGVPYMFGPGNHETDVRNTYISYLNRYKGQEVIGRHSGSGSSRYYSWDMPLVHFLMLDTDAWIYPSVTAEILQPMYEFARRDLASVDRSKTPWVVVIGHRAMYCTYESYNECVYEARSIRYGVPSAGGRKYGLEALLIEFGADLYVAGHTHHNERSYPVIDEVPVQYDFVNPKAPVHLLIGRAGTGGIDAFTAEPAKWDAFRDLAYTISYGRINIYNETHLDFAQLDGTQTSDVEVDSMLLIQDNHGPFSFPKGRKYPSHE